MGDTTAYVHFESLVMDLEDEGLLNKKVLHVIGETFRGMDMDPGDAGECRTDETDWDVFQLGIHYLDPTYDLSQEELEDDYDYGQRIYKHWKSLAHKLWQWP